MQWGSERENQKNRRGKQIKMNWRDLWAITVHRNKQNVTSREIRKQSKNKNMNVNWMHGFGRWQQSTNSVM